LTSDGARNSASAMAIRALLDRVAAKWAKAASEAVTQFCRGTCEAGELNGQLPSAREHAAVLDNSS